MHNRELTAQQRAAIVTYHLVARCEPMTATQVAEIVNTTQRGAQKILDRLACVLPIYRDDEDGYKWKSL